MKLFLKDRTPDKPAPLVMGILNVTPDSFSDGGRYLKVDEAVTRAEEMIDAGADIIDVGGESTRPGATAVDEDEEMERAIPVIRRIKESWDIPISIDTYKERVARAAVEEAGADMVNDISALRFSAGMAGTVAQLNVPVVLMHIRGLPGTMQDRPRYGDVIAEIHDYLRERIEFAMAGGIAREKIILDPGIGFGKRVEDNIAIIRELKRFNDFSLPLLIGISRKSFLGKISGEAAADKRIGETLTAGVMAILNGASIIRVHDVRETVASVSILRALL
jgi:dihydropteroate synthase